jgi:hypothetical protein
MATLKKRAGFAESELGKEIHATLQMMAESPLYNTESSYTSNTDQYADSLIPFVDKHMKYLEVHPKLDSTMYIANLRMMTKIKSVHVTSPTFTRA